MESSQPVDNARLLAHAAWAQRLALSLVGDPNAADDLAQDAWLTALEHPPRDASNPRGWLATVLVNLRRQSQRGAVRRRAREEAASRSEAQPDTLDVLARASMHKELVLAVLSLREPFRTVVLLRFFDEMPPRAIASQLDIPVHTVNSRLQRGLADLRAKLADSHGGGGAWMSALMPLALRATHTGVARSSWTSSTAWGALVMNTKWKIAAVLVLAVCGVLGLRAALDDTSVRMSDESEAHLAASETQSPPSSSALSVEAPSGARTAASRSVDPPASASPASVVALPQILRGRVLDSNAQPIHGLRIGFHPGEAGASKRDASLFAVSDANGAFEMAAPDVAGELAPEDPAYTAVLAGVFRPHASIEPVVVAARVHALAGTVRDESGAPLRGATVVLALDASFSNRFPHVLDASLERDWRAESDERGFFDLGATPWIEGSRLRTSLAGFHDDVRTAPDTADRALDVVLKPIELPEHHLSGDVRLASGAPVEGARVAFGSRTVETDASGRFAFDLAVEDASRVSAVKKGYLPAELEAQPIAPRWPSFVSLRLDGAPQVLAGKVVDAHGDGLAHVRLWLADPSFFGHVDGVPTQIENLLAGARSSSEQRAFWAGGGGDDGRNLLWSWFETDAHGRFRIEGLLARDYRLNVMDAVSLVQLEAGPFRAGREDVQIRVPASEAYEKVSGRVLAKNGEPVAGVLVEAVRRVVKIDDGGGGSISRSHSGMKATTDADGRFELGPIAREGIFLVLQSDRIVNTSFDFPQKSVGSSREWRDIDIHVVRRCHAQVELAGRTDRADEFAVLDARGERMPLSVIRGDNDVTGPTVQLVDGRSPVVALGEDGITLVLYSKKQETLRQPLTLVPGELTVVRP